MFAAEVEAFPEYYERYFGEAMHGGAVAEIVPLICTGPVSYRGQDAIQKDSANLKAALDDVESEDAFIPAVAPSGVGGNEFYGNEEEYLFAVAEAMDAEYRAIVDAGFILQIDDPWLTVVHSDSSLNAAARRQKSDTYVEALNLSLRGIPEEKVRQCWIWPTRCPPI